MSIPRHIGGRGHARRKRGHSGKRYADPPSSRFIGEPLERWQYGLSYRDTAKFLDTPEIAMELLPQEAKAYRELAAGNVKRTELCRRYGVREHTWGWHIENIERRILAAAVRLGLLPGQTHDDHYAAMQDTCDDATNRKARMDLFSGHAIGSENKGEEDSPQKRK